MDQDDAADAIQQFFHDLLEQEALGRANEERGRFRTYMLAMLKNFLAKQYRKQSAQKRGGNSPHLPIMAENWTDAHEAEISQRGDPEVSYDWAWAAALLKHTGTLLEQEYASVKKVALFHELRPLLVGDHLDHPYALIGERLGMSEGSVSVAVHRIRRRYGELIRQQVAETVSDPAETDDEIRFLMRVLDSQK